MEREGYVVERVAGPSASPPPWRSRSARSRRRPRSSWPGRSRRREFRRGVRGLAGGRRPGRGDPRAQLLLSDSATLSPAVAGLPRWHPVSDRGHRRRRRGRPGAGRGRGARGARVESSTGGRSDPLRDRRGGHAGPGPDARPRRRPGPGRRHGQRRWCRPAGSRPRCTADPVRGGGVLLTAPEGEVPDATWQRLGDVRGAQPGDGELPEVEPLRCSPGSWWGPATSPGSPSR